MSRQVAVVVGVRHVAGLPFLAGVVPGIDAFQQWAADQGFEVVRHDDVAEPVTADAIYRSIRRVVDAGDVARLFIFFSGHGLASGLGDDLWLLSDAGQDPAAAVNVARSVMLARSSGIPHVAVFADACRTPPDVRMQGLVGRPVFPQAGITTVRVQVDQFFATVSGDPSFEKQPGGGLASFGIFTRCLLAGLRGEAKDVRTAVAGGSKPNAILAFPLATWLWTNVRLVSSNEAHITQSPDCIPGSIWEPNVLAWIAETPDAATSGTVDVDLPHWTSEDASADSTGTIITGRREDVGLDDRPDSDADSIDDLIYLEQMPSSTGRDVLGPTIVVHDPEEVQRRRDLEDEVDRHQLLAEITDRISARPGRDHFETRIGASVVGASLVRAEVQGGNQGVFEEEGNWQVRGQPGRPAAALLQVQLTDGPTAWIATALVPGYVTTVTVGPTGADHIAFIPIGGDFERERRALAAAAASALAGRHAFVDELETRQLLDARNPTISLLAAYAFQRAGRQDDVDAILQRFIDAGDPIPYDIALLAGALQRLNHLCVPSYPLMTRGWALSDDLPAGKRFFKYARSHLEPSPWTTFDKLTKNAIAKFSTPAAHGG